MQILRRACPTLPAEPNRPIRFENDDKREGTVAYLSALNVFSGHVFGIVEDKTGIKPFQKLVDIVMEQEPYKSAHRAAGLKLIPTMAKECRKYGISLVLASQEAKDFNVSVFSAIANYLVLRLIDVDAKFLVRNVASSQHERVLIDKIKQMERFKAMYFSEERKNPSPLSLSPPL